MSDLTRRVAGLSPTKQKLLELRLKQAASTAAGAASSARKLSTGLLSRFTGLSPAKQKLLELKLHRQDAPATEPTSEKKLSTGLLSRFSGLSPAKQKLLELKLHRQDALSSKPAPEKKVSTGLLSRFSGLSPAKQKLLELKLYRQDAPATEPTSEKKLSTGLLSRFTGLSPAKQKLLELKLHPQDAPATGPVPEKKLSTGLLSRFTGLSPAKQKLLELKLYQQDAPPTEPTSEKKLSTGLLSRFSGLSPAKQKLLELKLHQQDAPPTEPVPEKKLSTGLLTRVTNLSPAKKALLALGLEQGFDVAAAAQTQTHTPERPEPVAAPFPTGIPLVMTLDEALSQIDALNAAEEAAATAQTEPPAQESVPNLAAGVAAVAGDAVSAAAFGAPDEVLGAPDWLSDEAEPEAPDWLTDDETTLMMPPLPATTQSGPAAAPQDTSETLSWLDDFEFEELDTPDWLTGADALSPSIPDQVDSLTGDDTLLSVPKPATDSPDIAAPASDDMQAAPPAAWLAATGAAPQTLTGHAPGQAAEAAGMLAGISTLLPPETVKTAPLETQPPDSLDKAAREFAAIATHTPQPAALPAPLTRREKLVGSTVKSVLLLLFVALVAMPLFFQDAENSRQTPWTEPSNSFSDVLDSQRRQLISEQLGIIDLQPPDSVALVSFDYSTATRGEMQPLAEAILGRLKGQGMRIIGLSLEPEGAIIAQKTLDKLLAERGGEYGVDAINLGFQPGQVAAVRNLVTNPQALAAIPDSQDGLRLTDPARATWHNIEGVNQVDIIVTLADNPATARWWIEQLEMAPQSNPEQFLLAGTSAAAAPFIQPYRDSDQLDGLISGITGAAAIEAGRNTFGPARQMLDSLSIAHLIIVILIAAGTIVAWMPASTMPASTPDTAAGEPEKSQATPEEKER